MYRFVFTERAPISYNSWRRADKAGYKKMLCDALDRDNKGRKKYNISDELYGVIYYFHKNISRRDVDNISKPIWDCLNGYLYDSDEQLKITVNGILDIASFEYIKANMAKLDHQMVHKLYKAVGNKEHVLYIECGRVG
ncbi:MAG: RusA family crossover junction endodeoxyribonuclease [Candidatus Magnetobacterium sp. LHC-1]